MISRHTQISSAICFILALAALPMHAHAQDTHLTDKSLTPSTTQTAHALPNDFAEMQAITADALNDLDHGELTSASTKIRQVTQILKIREWDSADTANIHIAQALILYNRFHYLEPDLAKEAALESFKFAIKLDPNIKIPTKYRSEEIKSLFKLAHYPDEPPPDYDSIFESKLSFPPQTEYEQTPSQIEPPVSQTYTHASEPPSITHTPPNYCNICAPCNISAIIPQNSNLRAILYYTKDPTISVSGVEMLPSNTDNTWSSPLPIADFDNNHVFYYINVLDQTGKVVARAPKKQKYIDLNLVNICKETEPPSAEHASEPSESLQSTATNQSINTESQNTKSSDDPLVQFSILLGTAFGVINDTTENCSKTKYCAPHPGTEVAINTGIAPLPLHLRANILFNLPKHFQIGAYLRGQLINITKDRIYPSDDINPAQYNIMVGLTARYHLIWKQHYRLYFGLGFGWGGANATVNMGPYFNNFYDIYLYKGPVHFAPEIGFQWNFHKKFGLAFEFVMPIVFPERPSVFFDFSIGPYIQF